MARTGKFDSAKLGEPQPRLASGEDWRAQSACLTADPELFFEQHGESDEDRSSRESQARAYCDDCSVRTICLAVAQDNGDEGGMFGGLNDEERRALRRKTKRGARTERRTA